MMLPRSFAGALAGLAGGFLAIAPAWAGPTWPKSIVGSWEFLSNVTNGALTISTETAGGHCQNITGTMRDTSATTADAIQGYYCPTTGAVAFFRTRAGSAAAFQVYNANLSQAVTATSLQMSGSFSEYNAVGQLGQYSFLAQLP